jgi:filamentous hemagglutinin
MIGLFSSFKNLSHLLREAREYWGLKLENGATQHQSAPPQDSTLDSRPSTLALQVSNFRSLPLPVRVLASFLCLLLFLTSSPPLLAITMGQIKSGMGTSGGGRGSAANLQNAGGASADITAALAQGNLKKVNDLIAAMQRVQADARKALPDASFIPNGLQIGGLEPYRGVTASTDAGNTKNYTLPVTWNGVDQLQQVTSDNKTTVNITQSSQNAFLYWNKFNVGQQTTVNFNLADNLKANPAQSIAFNKVMSASDPSHIFGNIKADGQVYILNQNGILFHNGSTVNTRSLVASTLPINSNLAGDALDRVTGRGIANNPDYQFLFSSIPVLTGKNGPTPKFDPTVGSVPVVLNPGNVVVEKGATITAPVDENNSGGLVALVGPNVRNEGTINTPNGQTILAAGQQVGFTPHLSADPSLRGMDVYVGNVTDASGGAVNAGLISAPFGDITIAGKTVSQNGVIQSSTSVSLNGRVDLLANYNAEINPNYNTDGSSGQPILYRKTGLVETAPNSSISILPDWQSADTVIGTSLSLNSIISIVAQNIHFGIGSIMMAPGAVATPGALSESSSTLDHGVTLQSGTWYDNGKGETPFLHDMGQIYLDSGSVIDVAGSAGYFLDDGTWHKGISVSSSQNYLTLQLRGAELANSPLQKSSAIRGKNITVDIRNTGSFNGQYWIGTPLGDATGYAGLIQRSIGQLTVNGGSIALEAGNSIVVREGAELNVSGGWIKYSGGTFSTTKLINSYGAIIDISNATPDQVYVGIVKSPASFDEAPYLSGGNGGGLSFAAPVVALDGGMYGNTVTGLRQLRTVPGGFSSQPPLPSSFVLSLVGETVVLKSIVPVASENAPDVTFAQKASSGFLPNFSVDSSTGIASQIPIDRACSITLGADLASTYGFGSISIADHDGSVVIPTDVSLNMGNFGSLGISASQIRIDGSVLVPGGTISLTASRVPYYLQNGFSTFVDKTQPVLDILKVVSTGELVGQYGSYDGSGRQQVLDKNGTPRSVAVSDLVPASSGSLIVKGKIDASGIIVNDFLNNGERGMVPININGGQVNLSAYSTSLSSTAQINVSGGAFVPSSGGFIYGNAGSLSLSGGQDTEFPDIHSGNLSFDPSTLNGFAGLVRSGVQGGKPGSLSIKAPFVVIGNTVDPGGILLLPSFFDLGGFGSFQITGVGRGLPGAGDFEPGVAVSAGAVINPQISYFELNNALGEISNKIYQSSIGVGFAPTLSLVATGLNDTSLPIGNRLLVRGDLIVNHDSTIVLNPGLTISGGNPVSHSGVLSLNGDTITEFGNLTVPGGSILIKAKNTLPTNRADSSQAFITLDVSGILSTQGETLAITDPTGLRKRYGMVLRGGDISLSGNILVRPETFINASGASGIFDDAFTLAGKSFQDYTDGGSINITGGQIALIEGLFKASASGGGAVGGSLSVSFSDSGTLFNLILSQSGHVVNWNTVDNNQSSVGNQLFSTDTMLADQGVHFRVSSFLSGGFDSLTLGGNVFNAGAVSISLPDGKLVVASGGIIGGDGVASYSAASVSLGRPFSSPLALGDPARTTVFGTVSNPQPAQPSYGTGEIEVDAQSLVNIGNLSAQKIGSISVKVSQGAIRGDGNLVMAGELTLEAAQIYPVSGVDFRIISFDSDASGQPLSGGNSPDTRGHTGSILINQQGDSGALPYSAQGNLILDAHTINQSGTLVAPLGTIQLGFHNGTGNPTDPLSGLKAPDTSTLKLSQNSVTSVSAENLWVPFGTSSDGTSWIAPSDPSGQPNDISVSGLVGKSITLSAGKIDTELTSKIDLSGGGSVEAVRWISGLGGTINLLGDTSQAWAPGISYKAGDLVSYKNAIWSARRDNTDGAPSIGANWSQLSQSYAVIPGYQASYAPTGYSDEGIGVGSRVRIQAGGGLVSGDYTLLPAIYAEVPGAYLISVYSASRSTRLPISIKQQDGSVIVSGTIYNELNRSISVSPDTELFRVLSSSVLASRAQYSLLNADQFFAASGTPLPKDAGKLIIDSRGTLTLNNQVAGLGLSGGVNAAIDISAPGSFVIGSSAGSVQLNPDLIKSWTYGSFLIGGTRGNVASSGTVPIKVTADSITIDSGVQLSGADMILVANNEIQFGEKSGFTSLGTGLAPDQNITLNGSGCSVRISNDPGVSVSRTISVSGSEVSPLLDIGKDVSLQGASLLLDSSSTLHIDQNSKISASNISISAGKVTLVLDASEDITGLTPLVLQGSMLDELSQSKSLNISSYSTLDIYGGGSFGSAGIVSLGLHAGEIRGFDLNGSTASFVAQTINLDNSTFGSSPGPVTGTPDGQLEFNASTITIGKNLLAIDQFAGVSLNATGVIAGTSSGSLTVGTSAMPTDLFLTAPLITATAGNSLTATASGNIVLQAPDPGHSTTKSINPGAGASLSFTGSSVSVDTILAAPSGYISLHATAPETALNGDVNIGGNGEAQLDVSGVTKTIQSVTTTADAGTISIQSDNGNVSLGVGASMNLSASGSSSAGMLNISAPAGLLTIDPNATLNAAGGSSGGANGSFSLDVSSLDPTGQGPSLLSSIIPQLSPDANSNGGFTKSISFRIRTGDVNVDTYIKSRTFSLVVDQGSIDVTGVIDASGMTIYDDNGQAIKPQYTTGGTISLQASGNVTLEPGSLLTVHGDTYDNAGKGGSVFLSAGAEVNGQINSDAVLDLQTGSAIDLGVTAAPKIIDAQGDVSQFGGVLHLRAPITQDGTDIQIAHMDSTIDPSSFTYTSVAGDTLATAAGQLGISIAQLESANNLSPASLLLPGKTLKSVGSDASNIEVEGYQLYELSGSTADLAQATPINVQGLACTGSQAVQQLALANAQSFYGSAGADSATATTILSRLNANQDSTVNKILNLSPGVEIINQSGDLTLNRDWDFSTWRFGANSSPGFLTIRASGNISLSASLSDGFISSSYNALLLPQNTKLPANFQSWTYTMSAGSDLDSSALQAASKSSSHNLELGVAAFSPIVALGGLNAVSSSVLTGKYYQVIRTGTGDINLGSSGSMIIWNQLASIYTAGVAVTDPTLTGSFDTPQPFFDGQGDSNLGAVQQDTPYASQFSYSGGNISLNASLDILHLTKNATGSFIDDSTREMPFNWLYRRGAINLSNSDFLNLEAGSKDVASTTWWVDFSNFNEGVGALGGGNISMSAGRNISNIDAVIPTNFRMPGKNGPNPIQPDASNAIELGGGDLNLATAGSLNGGVYYVENGLGKITARSIITNPTRDPQLPKSIDNSSPQNDPASYLPTTLFVGKSSFVVKASGDILLGPAANVFLLPQGINNSFWYRTYFSTFSQESEVLVNSLAGNVVLRTAAAGATSPSPEPILSYWLSQYTPSDQTISYFQPWTRVSDQTVSDTLTSLMPSSLDITALSGNITFQGGVTLNPSPIGNLTIIAAGNISGLAFSGINNGTRIWSASTINVSDADPLAIPGISSPRSQLAALSQSDRLFASENFSQKQITDSLALLFQETGSFTGQNAILQTKQALHGTINGQPLHEHDPNEVVIATQDGNISGIALYSPKEAMISSGGNLTDIGLYIQNLHADDISTISAAQEMTLYDPLSSLQKAALIDAGAGASIPKQYGDIQVSGPGALVVKAGGNIDLGNGLNNSDGTGVGITSIGNSRNPALPFAGADIHLEAGFNFASLEGVTSLLSSAESMIASDWNSLRTRVLMNDPKVIDQWGNTQNASENLKDQKTYSYLVSKDLLWIILHVEDSLSQEEYNNKNQDPASNLDSKLKAQLPELWSFLNSKRIKIQSILNENLDSTQLVAKLEIVGFSKSQATSLEQSKKKNSAYQLSTDDLFNSITSNELSENLKNNISDFFNKIKVSTDFSDADKIAISEALFYSMLKLSGRNYVNPDSPEYKTYDLGGQAIAGVYGESWYENALKNLGDSDISSLIQAKVNALMVKNPSGLSDSEKNALDYLSNLKINLKNFDNIVGEGVLTPTPSISSIAPNAGSLEYLSDLTSQSLRLFFDKMLLDSEKASFVSKDTQKISTGAQSALSILFGNFKGIGSVITWSRDIRTKNGGSINIDTAGGGVSLANTTIGSTLAPPGIITEHGGGIDIYAKDNVDIGIGRIFTLRGGDILMWSDNGNIAAGSSAKTVASAPPTRVLIDPQSGSVENDLAGLATGGGIGVLATVKNAPLGDVDLIAVTGFIDAGDAGIVASAKLNLATTDLRNGDNITAPSISGAPSSSSSAPPAAAPPAAAPPAAASAAAAANNSASETASKNNAASQGDEIPSVFTIDILGYGGGEEDQDKKSADATIAPTQASL